MRFSWIRRQSARRHAGAAVVALLATNAARVPARSALAQPSPARIPLVEGLTIVTPVSEGIGDYEAITRVIAITDSTVRTSVSGDLPVPKLFRSIVHDSVMHVKGTRTVLARDLREAHLTRGVFDERDPERFPGSTADGPSLAVLDDLRRTGQSVVRIVSMRRRMGFYPQVYEVAGIIRRVEPSDVPFPVLVNGARAVVPAIHVRGRLGDGKHSLDYEAWYLDHPRFPMTLRTMDQDSRSTVVSIAWPSDSARHAVERALMKDRHALLYGIYFSFASDSIRSESESVLREIADAMHRHPEWRIRLEGHTDAIGDAASNQRLSQQRVDAVKRALVARFGIADTRLTTQGFGKSRPIDTNDTPEGRARNRRVELTLQ